jgi:hypothetical protein
MWIRCIWNVNELDLGFISYDILLDICKYSKIQTSLKHTSGSKHFRQVILKIWKYRYILKSLFAYLDEGSAIQYIASKNKFCPYIISYDPVAGDCDNLYANCHFICDSN